MSDRLSRKRKKRMKARVARSALDFYPRLSKRMWANVWRMALKSPRDQLKELFRLLPLPPEPGTDVRLLWHGLRQPILHLPSVLHMSGA